MEKNVHFFLKKNMAGIGLLAFFLLHPSVPAQERIEKNSKKKNMAGIGLLALCLLHPSVPAQKK